MLRKNILLVDDDKDIQNLVAFYLEQVGFVVKVAEDGFSAMTEIQSDHYDLLLLDISMPYMNGFKVLKTLRTMEKYKHFPVIMLTGSNDKKDFERVRSEVSDYIIKPPKRDDLISRVERILGGRPQFEELKIKSDDPLAQGQFLVPFQILSVSHQGMVISSQVPMSKNSMIEMTETKLFQHIDLSQKKFKIVECAQKKDGTYEFFISFLGMEQSDRARLHDWLMSRIFTEKNTAT